MLALGSYNPAIITVLIDRYQFCIHHVTVDDSDWQSKLRDFFLEESDGREKVLLFDSVESLKKAQPLSEESPEVKSIVFDTPRMLSSIPSARILDLEYKEGRVYQQKVVPVPELNAAISRTDGNFLVDIKEVSEEEEPSPEAEDEVVDDPPEGSPHYELKPGALSGVLNHVLSLMASDVRSHFRERSLMYVTGQLNTRSLGGAKRKARNAGAPKSELDKLTKHMNGSECTAISDAFYAISKGMDVEDACTKAEASVNEVHYVMAYLDPNNAEFIREAPEFL